MNFRKLLSNFGVAALAQLLSLAISLLMSFIVPKILGMEEFGYWQLFLFYVSYVGLFMLGLNDGVYLIHGGKSLESLDKRAIVSQYYSGLIFQCCAAAIISIIACISVGNPSRLFVILGTAGYLVICNSVTFLGYVFQAVNETKWYSFSSVLDKVVFMLPLVILAALGVDSFRPYVMFSIGAKCVALAYSLFKARDFFRFGVLPPRAAIRESLQSMRVGINLMVANIAGMLMLGIARFSVDHAWGIQRFGQLSFALTLENFYLVFISQFAMVLFPALRQSNNSEVRRVFDGLRIILSLLLPATYLMYYPIRTFVSWWLPDYSSAVAYLAVLLPMVTFETRMNVLGTTYLKVLREERLLLIINVVAAIASAVGVLIGIYVGNNIIVVLLAVVTASGARSILAEHYVARRLDSSPRASWCVDIGFAIVFALANRYLTTTSSFLSLLVLFFLYLAIRWRTIMALLSQTLRSFGRGDN